MAETKRESGFYWVRLRGYTSFAAGWYLKGDKSWLLPGRITTFKDIDFEYIDERKIVRKDV